MDIGKTIREVREEYIDYLRETYPNWEEHKIKNQVSNAFYLWSSTIVPSFWKSLIDDDSMKEARRAIYDYLKFELMSDKAQERTDIYFTALEMFKQFLDEKFGGVKNRIGYEIDCEVTIYKYAELVYDGQMTMSDALVAMVKEVPCEFGAAVTEVEK